MDNYGFRYIEEQTCSEIPADIWMNTMTKYIPWKMGILSCFIAESMEPKTIQSRIW